jgi:cytochrome P450
LTFLKHLALRLPSWLAVYISPAAKPHLEIQAEMENAIDEATAHSESKLAGDQDDDDGVDHLNIFYAILRNSRVEGKLKYPGLVTKDQMISEAFGLRIAGSDTIANACMIGTRYLIREDRVREKLAKELEAAWPDRGSRIPLERLEKLPYLVS